MTNKNKLIGVRNNGIRDDTGAYSGYSNQLKLNSANATNAYYSNETKIKPPGSLLTKPPNSN